MNRHLLYILLLCIVFASCKKVTTDFTYTPAEPAAGEEVSFQNLSEGGEDYVWNFGDNQVSSTKSPSHTYSLPGVYTVSLREEKSGKKTVKTIKVADQSPAITASSGTIKAYTPITLRVSVYNPYNRAVAYRWLESDSYEITNATSDTDSVEVCFTQTGEVSVGVEVTFNSEKNTVYSTFNILNNPAQALLIQTSGGDRYYQRIYPTRMEKPQELAYQRGEQLLQSASTVLTAEDAMERKTYTGGADGLSVSHTDGTDKVLLFSGQVVTLCLSDEHNKLFFSTADAVYSMPLVHTVNNRTSEQPQKINDIHNVNILAIDNEAF